MNTNTVIAIVIALVVGAGGGYLIGANKALPVVPAHTMSMDDMMASMNAELEGKQGDEFDQAFLTEMTAHHMGAIKMAELARQHAKHSEIKQMADAIISAQTDEVEQMGAWRAAWYGTASGSTTVPDGTVHHAQ